MYFVYLVYLRFVGISFDSYHYVCLIFINLGMCILYIYIYFTGGRFVSLVVILYCGMLT